MTVPVVRPEGWPASPIRHSEILGRPLRQDGLETLGIEHADVGRGRHRGGALELALELTEYFAREIAIMNDVLFVWLADILDYRLARAGAARGRASATQLLAGFRRFQPGAGDLERARAALAADDGPGAVAAIELMRVRWAAQHDGLVVWICEVQSEIAARLRRGRHPRVGDPRLRAHLEAALRALGRHDPRAAAAAQRGGHARRPPLRTAPARRRGRQRRGRSLRHVPRPLRQLRRAAPGRSRQRPAAPSLGHQPGAPSLDPVPHRHELVQRPLDDRARVHPDRRRASRRCARSRTATCPTGPAAGSSTRTPACPAASTTSDRASQAPAGAPV